MHINFLVLCAACVRIYYIDKYIPNASRDPTSPSRTRPNMLEHLTSWTRPFWKTLNIDPNRFGKSRKSNPKPSNIEPEPSWETLRIEPKPSWETDGGSSNRVLNETDRFVDGFVYSLWLQLGTQLGPMLAANMGSSWVPSWSQSE